MTLAVSHRPAATTTVLLLAGFAAAVAVRVSIGGVAVARSAPAGLGFAAALAVLAMATRAAAAASWRGAAIGLAGGALLCAPVLAHHLLAGASPRPAGSFAAWAAVVTVVAVAEEAFLRGALYDAVAAWRGEPASIAVAAICFALLHVPLYGWGAVPLDTAVGVWLGLLRHHSRGWAAPALAHTLADLAGWWLR